MSSVAEEVVTVEITPPKGIEAIEDFRIGGCDSKSGGLITVK